MMRLALHRDLRGLSAREGVVGVTVPGLRPGLVSVADVPPGQPSFHTSQADRRFVPMPARAVRARFDGSKNGKGAERPLDFFMRREVRT